MIVGHRALRLLLWLKLKGLVRRQVRRMRSVSGLLFMTIGVVLMGLWLGSILYYRHFGAESRWEGPLLRGTLQIGLAFFTMISVASALAVRGVYFQKQEIERLFSVPVSRSDLVRHRMPVDLARALLGALVLGVVIHRRMPVPVFGFVGAAVSVLTLGVVRQTASLLVGDARGRVNRFLRKHEFIGARGILAVIVVLVILLAYFGDRLGGRFGGLTQGRGPKELVTLVLENPTVRVLLAPFRPWAELMTSQSTAPFFGWLAVCAAIWLALYELTARLPIDYRELSLQTSEEMARRLRTLRRGGPFSGGRISDAAAGRRIPWLFGRGAFGAVAWIKTAAILRKARGTLFLSAFVLGLVTLALSLAMSELEREATTGVERIAAPILIGLLGMWYLAGGLRFDFRSDLDCMETIKSWPLHPRRLFLATLLPEALLISGLLAVVILGRAVLLEHFHPYLLVTVAGLPFITLGWLAVDNAIFLLAPVRFVPGQEGALHHAGRALVLVFVRFLVFSAALVVVGLPVGLVLFLSNGFLELDPRSTFAAALAVGFMMMTLVDLALLDLGGRMVRRFDLARDRS